MPGVDAHDGDALHCHRLCGAQKSAVAANADCHIGTHGCPLAKHVEIGNLAHFMVQKVHIRRIAPQFSACVVQKAQQQFHLLKRFVLKFVAKNRYFHLSKILLF